MINKKKKKNTIIRSEMVVHALKSRLLESNEDMVIILCIDVCKIHFFFLIIIIKFHSSFSSLKFKSYMKRL